MMMRAFETIYNVCIARDLDSLHDEMECYLFNAVADRIDNMVAYSEFLAMRDAYFDKKLDMSKFNSTIPHVIVEGCSVSQKIIRYFMRYVQIVSSLFGSCNILDSNLSQDFHLFGTNVIGSDISPVIPDNSKYLLMKPADVQDLVWAVVIGKDPIETLRKSQFLQDKLPTIPTGGEELSFFVSAISYISLRTSRCTRLERNLFHVSTSSENIHSSSSAIEKDTISSSSSDEFN
uniref:p6 protein n=1 Tax=Emaravirus fici TaxID=1980427 RepID=A0A290DAG2_9VIRU|nr:p6 protein [Emaravirus fici]